MFGLILAVAILSIALIVLLILLLVKRPQDYSQSFNLLQQRVGQIEEQVKKSVDEGSKNVGEKFESSLKVIAEVQKTVGSLEQANRQMLEIGKNMASLRDLLRPPQIRGSLGEFTLNNLLAQVLPAQSYETQYRFKNGLAVDAIVRIGGRLIPIDSKFPLDSFQRYLSCSVEDEKRIYLKEFERSVKGKIDDIATKYILQDENTCDFALMYIPSENVYYQTILKDDLATIGSRSIADYAIEKKVIPVSPNSIYAYLNVVALGLRGMQVERSAQQLMAEFGRLNTELNKFYDEFIKLGGHLNHARDTYDRADKQLDTFSARLSVISETAEARAIEEPKEP